MESNETENLKELTNVQVFICSCGVQKHDVKPALLLSRSLRPAQTEPESLSSTAIEHINMFGD